MTIRKLKREWKRLAARYCKVATGRFKPCSLRDNERAYNAMIAAYQAWQEEIEPAEAG